MQMERDELVSIEEARESVSRLNVQETQIAVKDMRLSLETESFMWGREGAEPLPVHTKEAISSLGKQTGIRFGAVNEYREDPDLVQRLVQFSLNRACRADRVIRVVHTDDEVVEMIDDEHPWLSPVELFDAVTEGVPGLIGLSKLGLLRDAEEAKRGSSLMEFEFLTENSEEPPQHQGDFSHSGLYVSWDGKISVEPFVFTLACTNGMLHKQTSQKSVRTMSEFREVLRKTITEHSVTARELLHRLISLDEIAVENPEQMVLRTAASYRISDRVARQLVEAAPSLPENGTMYDVVSMVTRHAQELKRGTRALQSVAGEMTFDYSQGHHCSRCGNFLNN
jgi:hypothetical protein